ncbi:MULTISPECIES: sarcosine oxidase subunit alpha family protein [unclassified Mesorhizobium]|uniref:sarcosine oxidase subunit alpha family protein n=1 Tax=unclassified Mesorhizobium TaxID=325217 RepID=UPI0019288C1C|nr:MULTISPECIES: sarcosine oxidase subunit alpha family protein [unclassified Mesorhizobium]BCG82904.1 sarcosine oxidase subunit alpha [Mesorhizobium sp. 113-3-3]BCG90781.1 sarcosine oxidase subunit alpha [Mesorhizobium sp. 113-3-9]
MTAFRFEVGGALDRDRPVEFSFNGRRLQGYTGDTLASALLANGECLVGRSFKYHRPRGIMSAGLEETSALLTVGRGASATPNTLATTEELCQGLEAYSQHCWPSLRFDIGVLNQLFTRFLGAGFYYKTFMGPGKTSRSWMFYERFIRRAAGLGRASREPDPDRYENVEGFCDLLVVGAGPAGLEAARVASGAGLNVILVERDFQLGGNLLQETVPIEDVTASAWLASRERYLRASPNIRILTRTTAFGIYDHGVVGLVERLQRSPGELDNTARERLWTIRAKRVVVAAGAIERPLIFGNNDRPGVMLASSMRSYANRWAVAAGKSAVIVTNNDSAYIAARDLAKAGIVTILVDAREKASGSMVDAALAADVEVRFGRVPLRAKGRNGVTGLQIGDPNGGHAEIIRCDAIGMSGGWSPTQHLLSQRGVRPVWSDELAAFLPGETREPIRCVGAASGVWGNDECRDSGCAGGAEAAIALGKTIVKPGFPPAGGWDNPIRHHVLNSIKGKAFVDVQNDVTLGDIILSTSEGYDAPELLKRYTTLGMGTDQGRTSAVNALALIAKMRGRQISEVGTTTFRPPFAPVSIGVLAGSDPGQRLYPTRRSPVHNASISQGANMIESGFWLRSQYFPQGAESLEAGYQREMRMVRRSVGICDVSSFGKISVQGPDAGEFLNRVYVNAFKSLPVGKARYGVMLRDDGLAMDDGTCWRVGEFDYLVTTTTACAGKVLSWLEELLETRWPDLRASATSVTEQWAAISIAGPRSRELLEPIITGMKLDNDAFPFMGVREGKIDGVDCRVARISFSGELGYEVYVPADFGENTWNLLLTGVKGLGGGPYGTETLDALAIEKGHIVGGELDGRSTLDDLGLGRMASGKKPFVGSVMRRRPELCNDNRAQLVGLVPVTDGETFEVGSILCQQQDLSGHGLGWVTSAIESPSLGHWIGIGMLNGGLSKWEGRTLLADNPIRGVRYLVKVVSPHFIDPEGKRLHG